MPSAGKTGRPSPSIFHPSQRHSPALSMAKPVSLPVAPPVQRNRQTVQTHGCKRPVGERHPVPRGILRKKPYPRHRRKNTARNRQTRPDLRHPYRLPPPPVPRRMAAAETPVQETAGEYPRAQAVPAREPVRPVLATLPVRETARAAIPARSDIMSASITIISCDEYGNIWSIPNRRGEWASPERSPVNSSS